MLEESDEASYIAKKQLAAQVRAYLEHSESDDADKLHSGLEAYLKTTGVAAVHTDSESDHSEAPARDASEPASDPPLADWWSKNKDSTPKDKKEKKSRRASSSDPGMTANGLFKKLLEGKTRISKPYIRKLLDNFTEAWKAKRGSKLSIVDDFNVPEDGQLIVVGDTHGQLEDVLTIFLAHGLPSDKCRYLFNGDIADRGDQASSILCLLFAFFLENPDSIVINRGNHEDDEMNRLSAEEGGGFHEEVIPRYGTTILHKFQNIFKLLPLATIVNKELFVVHGGLARNACNTLTPSWIASIDATSCCCPARSAQGLRDQVWVDLIWSDPSEKMGYRPSPRGAGIIWGPDLTGSFLKRTGLKWIIRSHELPRDGRGWMEHHLGLVFTVFSASNYCGTSGNKGAVAILQTSFDDKLHGAQNEDVTHKGKLHVRFEEHYAAALEGGAFEKIAALPDAQARADALAEAGVVRAAEDANTVGQKRQNFVLSRMAGLVVERRPDLWQAFADEDFSGDGKISFGTWCEVLGLVCGDHFPWFLGGAHWRVVPCKLKPEMEDMVDYRSFLIRFKVGLSQERWVGWKALLMRDIYQGIFGKDRDLQATMALFDPNGTGRVSIEDFLEVLKRDVLPDSDSSQPLLTNAQLRSLARGLFPAAADGSVPSDLDVRQFFQRFTVVYRQAAGMSGDDPLAEWRHVLPQIGALLLRANENGSRSPSPTSGARRTSSVRRGSTDMGILLERSFNSCDHDGNGYLEIHEFVHHLKNLPGIDKVQLEGKPIGEEQLLSLAQALESLSGATTGRINFMEFLEAFVVVTVDAGDGLDFAKGEQYLYEHILSFLYRHRHALGCGFASKDVNFIGRIAQSAFAEVLKSTDLALAESERHCTDAQVEALAEALTEDDGKVPYVEFLQGLVVRDARSGSKEQIGSDIRQADPAPSSRPGVPPAAANPQK
eukprot:gnl/TRDRNA2_/TRDRNA2_154538_c0_seq3.p1 gnl/TRDRNA2_/TRDRNA2_154538_c0~~gnl/TRDRNA2_/TRDRNA2_154538_c0_seq3.p1  ORF type:complete len:1082 (-),score=204.38 gnl/TRDRNA2_/TRDRNA2_154538_c0_seq3:253-3081(-)